MGRGEGRIEASEMLVLAGILLLGCGIWMLWGLAPLLIYGGTIAILIGVAVARDRAMAEHRRTWGG